MFSLVLRYVLLIKMFYIHLLFDYLLHGDSLMLGVENLISQSERKDCKLLLSDLALHNSGSNDRLTTIQQAHEQV